MTVRNEDLIGRLYNWKFESALRYLSDEPEISETDRDVIEALAGAFGNAGWFDGVMGVVVAAAVRSLIPPEVER